jgi:hypothetical protein
MRITFLPAIAIIIFMGLIMYIVGDNKKARTPQRRTPKQTRNDGVTFLPAVIEENAEMKAQ